MSAASPTEVYESLKELAAADGRGWTVNYVSWDDVSRTVGSALGPNITDTHLFGKGGERLFTVRPENFNERIGHLSADDIAVVVGNGEPSGTLRPITLRQLLREFGTHAQYVGVAAGVKLADEAADNLVSVRYQTVFLPVEDTERATYEFQPAMYSYQTGSRDEPRNMLVLCTTQGAHVQQPEGGLTKLHLHAMQRGQVRQFLMEAERTAHRVGGPQVESKEEREDALARGKATSCVIGPRTMGTRFNVLMTVQVPLALAAGQADELECCAGPVCDEVDYDDASSGSDEYDEYAHEHAVSLRADISPTRSAAAAAPRLGKAFAARVSYGTDMGAYAGVGKPQPERDESEHVTVTVVLYNVVVGLPSSDDVKRAIDDMERLYAGSNWSGTLQQEAESSTAPKVVTTTQPPGPMLGVAPPSAAAAAPQSAASPSAAAAQPGAPRAARRAPSPKRSICSVQ